MQYKEQKDAFHKIAVREALASPDQIERCFPLGHSLPSGKLERWLGRFLQVPTAFASQRRYVNRFRIGADPEFIFLKAGRRQDADPLGFKQGLAFGSDNNGRLAEIRPYPSRSALEVCASILATLRWMVVASPSVLNYEWHCGAFLQEDGLGGHVHFGRKRPTRGVEIKALDAVDEALVTAGFFSRADVERRRLGDQRGQHYGLPGDFRLQSHGYEYRSFPSWLDSPELAFVTLTLSKLAVHCPELVQWRTIQSPVYRQRLMNLLAYYKDTDDDARLALFILNKGVPRHLGGDFRERWGMVNVPKILAKPPQVIPPAIKPDASTVEEMFQRLLGAEELKWRPSEATWSPLTIPRGYEMLLPLTPTLGAKGLGELIWDLCRSEQFPLMVTAGREHVALYVPVGLTSLWPNGWQRKYGDKVIPGGQTIQVSSYVRDSGERIREVKKILLSGLFPIWKASDVHRGSYDEWKRRMREPRKKTGYISKVMFRAGNIPGL